MTAFDESLEPPERPDFRRVNRGVPLVKNVETGKWDRYRRASSAGNILDDESNLHDWRDRTIVAGAAQRPDLMAMASTLDVDTDKKELRDIAEDCVVAGKGTQRRNKGTAIHAMLDHVDLGHDWKPAPQYKPAVEAYKRALDIYGLIPIDVECKIVNDPYRIAGSMDRRYQTTKSLIVPTGEIVPIGDVVGGDTKTGQTLEYASGSYATQLAAYTHPETVRYDVVTNERTPFDPKTFEWYAIIVHVDAEAGTCDLYWVDLSAGRHALALAEQVRKWRKRTDLIVPARAPLHAVASEPVAEVDVEELVRASMVRHPSSVPPDAPRLPVAGEPGAPAPTPPAGDVALLADVRAWLRGRIAAVREAGEQPTAMLMRRWPTGVAGLKFDTQTADQLDAISEVVWDVEKEYSLPFPPTDPRAPKETEAQRDFADRWANPTGDDAPTDETSIREFREALDNHPRHGLMRAWSEIALANADPSITDRWALTHALYQFAMLPSEHWNDADVTEVLDGTLRAIGYVDGVKDLGRVVATDAPQVMRTAFAIETGTAMLMYGEDDKPVVRIVN